MEAEDVRNSFLATTAQLQEDLELSTSDREAAQAVAAGLRDSKAANTRRAYGRGWAAFTTWADAHGYQYMPAAPQTVALYLGHLAADGKSLATINQARAAISHAHAAEGIAKSDNPARHPAVAEAIKGWRNQAPEAAQQVDALTALALARIRETARLPRRGRGGRMESATMAQARGAVDLAIIGVMADGGLRRSEAAAHSYSSDISREQFARLKSGCQWRMLPADFPDGATSSSGRTAQPASPSERARTRQSRRPWPSPIPPPATAPAGSLGGSGETQRTAHFRGAAEMGGGAPWLEKCRPLEKLREKAQYQPANGGSRLRGANPEEIVQALRPQKRSHVERHRARPDGSARITIRKSKNQTEPATVAVTDTTARALQEIQPDRHIHARRPHRADAGQPGTRRGQGRRPRRRFLRTQRPHRHGAPDGGSRGAERRGPEPGPLEARRHGGPVHPGRGRRGGPEVAGLASLGIVGEFYPKTKPAAEIAPNYPGEFYPKPISPRENLHPRKLGRKEIGAKFGLDNTKDTAQGQGLKNNFRARREFAPETRRK